MKAILNKDHQGSYLEFVIYSVFLHSQSRMLGVAWESPVKKFVVFAESERWRERIPELHMEIVSSLRNMRRANIPGKNTSKLFMHIKKSCS